MSHNLPSLTLNLQSLIHSSCFYTTQFNSVQLLSCVRLFATTWIAACQASLSITQSSPRLTPIESVMPSSHLILCRPLLLLPLVFPSIRGFSNESAFHIMWPKYWSSSFSISLSNEYSVLISFRIDWLDFLAVQGTLKSRLHPSGEDSWESEGRREEGSGWGTRVYLWRIHVDIWQNQYNIIKLKIKIKLKI